MKFGCKQGHAYDKQNTYAYTDKEGKLRYRCKKCHAARQYKRDVLRRGYV